MLRSVKVAVTTTGSAGSASGTGYSGLVNGEIRALYVDYHASAPAGSTDVTITVDSDDQHPSIPVYASTNSATDAWVYPTVEQTDTAGAGVSAYQNVVGQGRLKVVVAQCDALTNAVVVYAYVWE